MELQRKLVGKFLGKHITVVGDVMLDKYIHGSVNRINPEAPVQVVDAKKMEYRLGGAANVARNITALGGKCTLIGKTGVDPESDKLKELLDELDIENLLLRDEKTRTTVKTRVMAGTHPLVRIDWEERYSLNDEEVEKVIAEVKKNPDSVIIVSDYNKGLINEKLMTELKKVNNKILGDPKPVNSHLFNNILAITPCLKELNMMTKDANAFSKEMNTSIVVTKGENGAGLITEKGEKNFSTQKRNVYDVSGAGDTFIATIALAIASGASLEQAIPIANKSAGIVVEKTGTDVVFTHELRHDMGQMQKLVSQDELAKIVRQLQLQGKKVAFTNGIFDVLHKAHVTVLKGSRDMADALIVGINSDASTKRYKGPTRPINNQAERAFFLSAFSFVDFVAVFEEDDPCNIIAKVKPDMIVKGKGYDPKDFDSMPEAKVVREYGGTVEIIKHDYEDSSTYLIEAEQLK